MSATGDVLRVELEAMGPAGIALAESLGQETRRSLELSAAAWREAQAAGDVVAGGQTVLRAARKLRLIAAVHEEAGVAMVLSALERIGGVALKLALAAALA